MKLLKIQNDICDQHAGSSEIWAVPGVQEYTHWQAFSAIAVFMYYSTSSFRDGLQVEKTMRLVIIQDISPLRAYQRTNSHPTFGKYNVGRRWGCVEVVCSESKWMMIMRWTYGQDCRRIHMLLTCRRKTPSASGPRLCSCGLGLVVFRSQLEFNFHQEIIFHLVKNKISLVNNRLVTN